MSETNPARRRGVSVTLFANVLTAVSDQMALDGSSASIEQRSMDMLTEALGEIEASGKAMTEEEQDKTLARIKERLEEKLEDVSWRIEERKAQRVEAERIAARTAGSRTGGGDGEPKPEGARKGPTR